jgi:predicted nucleic-acid-binding Zn-ribbon protein
MAQKEKCTKCGSENLIRVPIVPGEGPHIAVGDRLMRAVPITQIVCGRCGYIETWIKGEDNLKKSTRRIRSEQLEKRYSTRRTEMTR